MVNLKCVSKRVTHLSFTLKPAEESVSFISRCSDSSFCIINIRTTTCNCTTICIVSICSYIIGISCVINLENEAAISIDISTQCTLGRIKSEMLKHLLLSVCSCVGCTCKIHYNWFFITVLIYIFKIVFYLVSCICISIPISNNICICHYGSWKIIIPRSQCITYTAGSGFGNNSALFNNHTINGSATVRIKSYLIIRSATNRNLVYICGVVIDILNNVNSIVSYFKTKGFWRDNICTLNVVRNNVLCITNNHYLCAKEIRFSIVWYASIYFLTINS